MCFRWGKSGRAYSLGITVYKTWFRHPLPLLYLVNKVIFYSSRAAASPITVIASMARAAFSFWYHNFVNMLGEGQASLTAIFCAIYACNFQDPSRFM